jgi:hypothetical protein
VPRVERGLGEAAFRLQCGDDPVERVVEHHRADPDRAGELEGVGAGEERLVLADGLALVVEDGPAVADPARRAVQSGLGLHLALDLPAESVGVGECVLDARPLAWRQLVDMGFSGEGGGHGRCAGPPVRRLVVPDPGRRQAE